MLIRWSGLWGHRLGLKHARSQCENGLKFPFQILSFLPCPLDAAALILLLPPPMTSCPHHPAAQLLVMTHWFTNSSSLWASSVLLLHSVLSYQPVCFSTCAFVCFCFYLMPPDVPTVCFQQCVALHTVGNFPNQKSFLFFLKKKEKQKTKTPTDHFWFRLCIFPWLLLIWFEPKGWKAKQHLTFIERHAKRVWELAP